MILGSHNSLSFCRVKQWYLRPITFMGRCQKSDLNEQFNTFGARYFDIRVTFDKRGEPIPAHGIFHWDYDVDVALCELNEYAENTGEKVYVRLILEQNSKKKNQARYDKLFKLFCSYTQLFYKHLTFVGGNRKYDWKKLYDFGTEEPELDDKYSSTTRLFGERKHNFIDKLDDLWPWLYAKIHNKKLYSVGTNKHVLLIDFLNIK